MPLAVLTLPVVSSQGVVFGRVERWNKATGRYVAWRPLDDGSLRVNEFPPGCHDLLRAEPRPIASHAPLHEAPDDSAPEIIATPSEADATFLKALGFTPEELPNVERLAPYREEEARRASGRLP